MHRTLPASAKHFAVATITSLGLTLVAFPPDTRAAQPQSANNARFPTVNAPLMRAMQRDFGMDQEQAENYIAAERLAMRRKAEARNRIGASFSGEWLERGADGRFRYVITVTDAYAAYQARMLGAEARIVQNSLARLESAKEQLDRSSKGRRIDRGVSTWYVDVKSNQVVVTTTSSAMDSAIEFIAATGVDPKLVRLVVSEARPRTLVDNDMVGGYRYNDCSIGFPVFVGARQGFVTAGHCGVAGDAVTGADNANLTGQFVASSFPGNDYAWVETTNAIWMSRPWVWNYAGVMIEVLGGQAAPIGAAICRSGITTGYRCGTVVANNVTVNYPQGAVFGLVQSTACAGPGDSGGAFITPGGQAQGVTSGGLLPAAGVNNCSSNPVVTYHQPLEPILSQYGLTLATNANTNGLASIKTGSCFYQRVSERYICSITYNSPQPATVFWRGVAQSGGSPGFSSTNGDCRRGASISVGVRVANQNGSTSTAYNVNCF
jgi:Alpha-lytic protease prodomain/Trypsin